LIKKYTTLPSTYGENIVEFQTNFNADFNKKLASSTIDFVDTHLAAINKKTFNEKEFFSQSEDWHRLYFDITRARSDKANFVFLPFKEAEQLHSLIKDCLSRYLSLFKRQYNGNKPNYIHSWSNVFKKKQEHVPHTHHFNPINISGVYYVSGDFMPNNGELLIFPDKRNPDRKIAYQPKPGILLLFPSDLPHDVGHYDGDTLRISIAFDIWFKPQPGRNFLLLEQHS